MLNTVKQLKEKLKLLCCLRTVPLVSLSKVPLCSIACICQNMQFTISVLQRKCILQLLLLYVASYNCQVFITMSCIISLLLLHFSHCFCSLKLPSLPFSVPVSRLAEPREGTSVIRVPALSHQFMPSLTDPCAAQYMKKRRRPPTFLSPLTTRCNNKRSVFSLPAK